MNRKAKMLCAFALIFSCATSFAEENVSTETAKAGHHAAMGKAGATSPARAKQGPAKKTREAKAIVRKVTKEEMGKDAVCPVTGDKFKVTAETGSVSYKGKIYYFCCPACDKPFLENPEKYIPKKQTVQAKIYVCPMGDYQGDKPGKCPKCGMNLVEKK